MEENAKELLRMGGNLFMKMQFSILILSGSCIIFDLKNSGSMGITFFKMNQSQNAIF